MSRDLDEPPDEQDDEGDSYLGEAGETQRSSPVAIRTGTTGREPALNGTELAGGSGEHRGPARAGPDAATMITRPRRESGTTAGSQLATASPFEALIIEEVERVRVFAVLSLAICAFAMASLPFFGGNPTLKFILLGLVAGNFLASSWILLHIREAAHYKSSTLVPLALFATLTGHVVILYWGPFSPAPTLLVLGIYFFSRSANLAAVYLVYVLCAAGQALWAGLILSGTMKDRGLITGGDVPLYVHLVTQMVLQFVLFAAHTLARETRKSTLRAIDALLDAQRVAAQREALFEEVRQDLDRVLQIGGPGRHTDKVLGGYKLGVVIGRGAMGEVYEAAHERSGEPAAVKLLHSNVLAHHGSIDRFLREARAAGMLESPHVVRILDASSADAPLPFLVMERLHGHDLAYYLRRRRRLGKERLEELIGQLAGAIDEAGTKGIVHRDIKPQNLFLAERPNGRPVWKILDFGASKLTEHTGTLTEGKVVGTPSYMAPEQARGEDVSPSADVYALAAIAYRCLTGRPPFSYREIHTCIYHVCFGMPPQPSLMTELPDAIDAVLAVGLAKRAEDRFESAHELSEHLVQALAGHKDEWIERRAEALLGKLSWGTTPM